MAFSMLRKPTVQACSGPGLQRRTLVVQAQQQRTVRIYRPPSTSTNKADATRSASSTLAPSRQAAKPAVAEPAKTSSAGISLPSLSYKQKLVLAASLAFTLSNMDKTNFTVAVIPMGLEMGWSPTTAGLVQSAFFYGFLAMQVPGGILSNRLGGRVVLPSGLSLWSGATALIPLVAGNMPALCATRAIMGMGEAVAPSSIVDMISRAVPPSERASAVSFAFGGLHLGSIIGLLASPLIIRELGWPSLFYLFGAVGGLWLLWFESLMRDIEANDPALYAQLRPASATAASAKAIAAPKGPAGLLKGWAKGQGGAASASASAAAAAEAAAQPPPIPYRAFLRHPGIRTLMFTHFCHNWFHFTMLSWLPTYFTSTLSVDLMHAAQTALLPPIAGIAASAAAGALGDGLVARGVPTPLVRKMAQSTAFVVPTGFLAAASQWPGTPEDSGLVVACITAALGISSFSLAGLYCTHQDMSPKYASVLLGLTNVAGSMPGIIGVATVGFLYDQTSDWSLALFAPSAAFMLAGAAVYVAGSQHDPVDFDALDNSRFGWERKLHSAWEASPFAKAWAAVRGTAARPAASAAAKRK